MKLLALIARLNKAKREREDAYHNLEKMREFKLTYLENLIQITKSADIFKTNHDYAELFKVIHDFLILFYRKVN